jgi:hypothetical protein
VTTAFSAANHSNRLIFSVTPRNRYGLWGAARRARSRCEWRLGRVGNRRTPVCPVPGDIVGAGEAICIDVQSGKGAAVGSDIESAVGSDPPYVPQAATGNKALADPANA